jgi:hypothetical protein
MWNCRHRILSLRYHTIRKVRATHILLNSRITTTAYAECTHTIGTTHCQRLCKSYAPEETNPKINVTEVALDRRYCIIAGAKTLIAKEFLQM